MYPDYGTLLLAQTTVITEQHYYLHFGDRRIEISPSVIMAGFTLVVLAFVATVLGLLIFRNRAK